MTYLSKFFPSPTGIAREIVMFPTTLATLCVGLGELADQSPVGDGHRVVVLPGFTAPDATTLPLRRFLQMIGYRSSGWGLGWNLGISTEGEHKLESYLQDLVEAEGPVTLIGWSLGGVYAREAARRRPDLVRQVITIGTPIRNRDGADWIVNIFRLLNPSVADELTPAGTERHAQPLEVPTVAIYSRYDGILNGRSCRVRDEDVSPEAFNVEVKATHLAMGFSLPVLALIAEILGDEVRSHPLKAAG